MKRLFLLSASGSTLAGCFVLLYLASATIATTNAVAQQDPPLSGWMSFVPGDYLYDHCSSPDREADLSFCEGYIVAQAEAASMDGVICLESPLSSTTLVEVVKKFLGDHSEFRDHGAAWVVRKSLDQTFSCKAEPKKESSDSGMSRPSASNNQTATTFRGHTLGESWQAFLRTVGGLCQIKGNAEDCSKAAAGDEANLSQFTKGDSVIFNFEYGRFASATVRMNGPSFAELTYFEKTYGKPSLKRSHPENGTADSYWHFPDGGEAYAKESKATSGTFMIRFRIQASDYALRPGPLAANSYAPIFNGHSLGESWEKFIRTGGGLCQLSEDNAHACKDAAAGKFAILVGQSTDGWLGPRFTFRSGHLVESVLHMRVPKFIELDYLDKTYGHPYYNYETNSPDSATRRWDYSDGGQIVATETFVAPDGIVDISTKTVLLY